MSEHETYVQYVKIGLGLGFIFFFSGWAIKVVSLLSVIANK